MSLHKNLEIATDFVSDFPDEISEKIFLDLPPTTLLNCRRVSKSWKQIVDNDYIWRSKFQDQKFWTYNNEDSETDSWYELYKERYRLELNWKNGIFTKHRLNGHSALTYCVKFFKNWIITASDDYKIKIRDSETYQCLRIFGEPDFEILKPLGITNLETFRVTDLLELTKDIDIEFHLSIVKCMDINDKYLVTGSYDGCCIIWGLPDFKPIYRLITPTDEGNIYLINGVVLYNNYLVCSNLGYIGVWKSNFDNELQFNLQHRLKTEMSFQGVSVHNGIIYGIIYGVGMESVRSWNIETGQNIQEFRYNDIRCSCNIAVNDQYLFVNDRKNLTVLNLQTNKINILSDEGPFELLLTVNNKIISIHEDCTIYIWNLNDLKLFKKIVNSNHEKSDLYSCYSIDADLKRLAAFAIDRDVIIYDFTKNLRKRYLKHL